MITKKSISRLSVGLSVIALTACDFVFPPPVNPDPPFTKQQILEITKCQASINKGGRRFTSASFEHFEACLEPVLNAQLRLESGIIDQTEFDNRVAKARESCQKRYDRIDEASTMFVDGVMQACGPIGNVVLGPDDPLQFQALAGELGEAFPSIEVLAGFLCGAKAFAADSLVGLQFPRKCYILETLGPEFGDTDDEDPPEFCFPLTPLDDRCNIDFNF